MTPPSTNNYGIDPSQIDSNRIVFADASFLTEFVRVFGPENQGKEQLIENRKGDVLGTKKTKEELRDRAQDRNSIFRELARRISTHPQLKQADPTKRSDILTEDVFAYDDIEATLNISISSEFRDALEDLRTRLDGKTVDDMEEFLHDCQRLISRQKRQLVLVYIDWKPLQCDSNLKSRLNAKLSDDVIYSEVSEIVTYSSQDRKLVLVDEDCVLLDDLDAVNDLIAKVLTPSNRIDADYLTTP